MSAIPEIPHTIRTLAQLDDWITVTAPQATGLAARLRLAVAVIERATEIGDRARATDSGRRT